LISGSVGHGRREAGAQAGALVQIPGGGAARHLSTVTSGPPQAYPAPAASIPCTLCRPCLTRPPAQLRRKPLPPETATAGPPSSRRSFTNRCRVGAGRASPRFWPRPRAVTQRAWCQGSKVAQSRQDQEDPPASLVCRRARGPIDGHDHGCHLPLDQGRRLGGGGPIPVHRPQQCPKGTGEGTGVAAYSLTTMRSAPG